MTSLHRLSQLSSHLLKVSPVAASKSATVARTTAGLASQASRSVLLRNLTSATIAMKQQQQYHRQLESPSPSPTILNSTPTSDPIPPSSQTYDKREINFKDRAFYGYALDIQTRWADNDQYGHLNNAHYYALFDTVINTYLIQEGGLQPHANDSSDKGAIGVCAESGCQYFNSVGFPDIIEARLAVTKLGTSSVVYRVGIFKKLGVDNSVASQASASTLLNGTSSLDPHSYSAQNSLGAAIVDKEAQGIDPRRYPSQVAGDAVASGHFCHVFVDRTTRRPVPIPEPIRTKLEALLVKQS
ncbi:hypothetical protein BGZ73_005195 [Actinomortierella ambigua]|nr:hypothetical protein BGZ73_005195 [Actinomortierella ambigua]